jgi:hypothetical protein
MPLRMLSLGLGALLRDIFHGIANRIQLGLVIILGSPNQIGDHDSTGTNLAAAHIDARYFVITRDQIRLSSPRGSGSPAAPSHSIVETLSVLLYPRTSPKELYASDAQSAGFGDSRMSTLETYDVVRGGKRTLNIGGWRGRGLRLRDLLMAKRRRRESCG